jgi:hypothetical protein
MIGDAGAQIGNYATNKSVQNQMKKLKELEKAADTSTDETTKTTKDKA